MKRNLFMLLTFVMITSMLMSLSSFAVEKTDKIDFNNATVGTDGRELEDLSEKWEVIDYYAGDVNSIVGTAKVKQGTGDGKCLTLSGYVDISSYILIKGSYTYSIDIQLIDTNFVQVKDAEYVAFFVRGVIPVNRSNPAYGNNMDIIYYESDWYEQNGGKDGPSLLGGSGIAVYPMENSLRVNIKTYVPDAIKMGNAFYDFPYPEDFDKNNFFNLKFVDSGNKVEIFIDNEILATIEMSEKDYYEDDEEDDNDYFKKAVMKDKTGAEVLSTDSARINADGSQLAIGTRNNNVNVDNITLTFDEPDPTPTPTTKPTLKKTQTPVATGKPLNGESEFPTTLIIIIVAAVVVGVGIIIVISKKKKKKKQ